LVFIRPYLELIKGSASSSIRVNPLQVLISFKELWAWRKTLHLEIYDSVELPKSSTYTKSSEDDLATSESLMLPMYYNI